MLGRKFQKSSKWDNLYLPAQKYQVVNDGDPVLEPVVLRLPDPPDIHYIDGYGLNPLDQKFEYEEIPQRLKYLEEAAYNSIKDKYQGSVVSYHTQKAFWKMLNDESDNYVDEINWIKRVRWHFVYGYWFFCKGTPTWITPWHYVYLNFYYAKYIPPNNKPFYRDEDRVTELWEWYAYTATETFKTLDDKGNALHNENGEYEMVDVGRRVCFGTIQPKRRRRGESMKAGAKSVMELITQKEKRIVSQANTGAAAEDLYQDHVLPAWKNLFIAFRPIYDGNNDPSKGIILRPPGSIYKTPHLDSAYEFNESGKEGANDRKKIHLLDDDEVGKNEQGSVKKRWAIDKLTLAQGQIIHGFSIHPSTVEEMTAGGEAFKEMWDGSEFYQRNGSGQTFSGLYRIFRPCTHGYDGYIDPWGYSVIDRPTEDQLKYADDSCLYAVTGKGSKQYWQEEYASMLADVTRHDDYRLGIRKNPMVSTDCWRGGAGDLGFNYILIDQSLARLNKRTETTRGNFMWQSGRDSRVVWVDDQINGRFVVSNFYEGQDNKWVYGDNVWDENKGGFVPSKRPMNPHLRTASADPFDYGNPSNRKTEFRVSDGGGAVVDNYNPLTEESQDMRQWKTFRLICTYSFRPPSLEEYLEDMLMMCVYYGALLNFESNKKRIWEYFVDRGYGGYLLYMRNPDGTFKDKPGTYAQGGTVDEMFNAHRDYINFRGHLESHAEYLNDARNIREPNQLYRFDRFAAVGWALLGSKSNYGLAVKNREYVDTDIETDYDPPYVY